MTSAADAGPQVLVDPPPSVAVADGGADLVFHAGRYVPADEAVLPLSSIALRYAVSVFEGIRLYRQRAATSQDGPPLPWQLPAHLDRLRQSMRLMDLPDPGVDAVPEVLEQLVARNQIRDDSYARVSVSAAGPGLIADDAEPVLTVSVSPAGRKRWLARDVGMSLTVSCWTRPGSSSFPAAAKNVSAYAGPRIAQRQARAAGYDGCLLTTAAGLVCEAPTATVFVLRRGVLTTPRLEDGVLPGITRAWVLAVAASGVVPGLAVGPGGGPAAVRPADLVGADEVFLCGTGLEFGPVAAVDEVACRSWPAAPVTRALVRRYLEEVRGAVAATDVDWSSR